MVNCTKRASIQATGTTATCSTRFAGSKPFDDWKESGLTDSSHGGLQGAFFLTGEVIVCSSREVPESRFSEIFSFWKWLDLAGLGRSGRRVG